MVDFMRRCAIEWMVLALLGLGLIVPAGAEPGNDNRAPDVGDYTELRAPAGHKVAFQAYAEGVQIWRWNGTSWVFSRPEAVLYSGGEEGGIVGIHYAGPTWESVSGSYVKGAFLAGATVDSSAIPWLLLRAVESDGPGIFDGVTHIQRVNTVGGLAPADPGDFPAEEARVLYTADYYFYRKHKRLSKSPANEHCSGASIGRPETPPRTMACDYLPIDDPMSCATSR